MLIAARELTSRLAVPNYNTGTSNQLVVGSVGGCAELFFFAIYRYFTDAILFFENNNINSDYALLAFKNKCR